MYYVISLIASAEVGLDGVLQMFHLTSLNIHHL
jgi:hypothetical protein